VYPEEVSWVRVFAKVPHIDLEERVRVECDGLHVARARDYDAVCIVVISCGCSTDYVEF
jgi:hypothetical protein